VKIDWQKAELAGIGKKTHVQVNFDFFEDHIVDRLIFPIQYDQASPNSSFKFEINPRTGFDDWAPIELLNQCESEIKGYKNWELPALLLYAPIETERKYRNGAEEEYFVRGKTGAVE